MVRPHPLRRFDPAPPAPRPRRGAAWLGLGAAAALATAIYFSRPAAEIWLLARWQTEVAAYSADEAAAAMNRAAENGPWGRRLLVAALDSPNDAARLAAIDSLRSLLADWKQDAALDHTTDVTTLARSLAESSPRWSPLQTAALEPLIVALANWRLDTRAPGLSQFTADCETLVRLLQEQQPTRLAATPREEVKLTPAPIEPQAAYEPPVVPPAPIVGAEDPPAAIPAIPPTVAPPTSSRRPPPPAIDDGASPELMLELLPPEPGHLRRIDPPRELDRRRESPRKSVSAAAASMTKLTDWEVITLLHAENTVQTAAAEEELFHRGYRRPDLAIARRAADPSPAVRKKLAEDLPRLTGVDTRRWLQQLAQDEDGGVRSVAHGILRTTQDPALRR